MPARLAWSRVFLLPMWSFFSALHSDSVLCCTTQEWHLVPVEKSTLSQIQYPEKSQRLSRGQKCASKIMWAVHMKSQTPQWG